MHFPARAALILFLSIFGHKIGVLKSPALFRGKSFKFHGHVVLVPGDVVSPHFFNRLI